MALVAIMSDKAAVRRDVHDVAEILRDKNLLEFMGVKDPYVTVGGLPAETFDPPLKRGDVVFLGEREAEEDNKILPVAALAFMAGMTVGVLITCAVYAAARYI